MNFVMDFDVDDENRPRGCNIPLVYGDSWFEDYATDPCKLTVQGKPLFSRERKRPQPT